MGKFSRRGIMFYADGREPEVINMLSLRYLLMVIDSFMARIFGANTQ